MSKKKKARIVVLVVLAIVAVLVGTVYFLGHRYYVKTNFVSDEEAVQQIEQQKAEKEAAEAENTVEEDEVEEEEPEEGELDPELLEAQENMARYASTEPITTDGNVYNVVLVGLDTTEENWVGNSDSMILISINYRLHKISMISLMRDTRALIPGVGYRKLNAAYPNGGGPLLTQTIEENFKIDVDRYVTVDFGNMIDIVDEIGKIEITFTPKEAENANKSIKQQCRILGLKSKKYLIPGEGTYMCNGMQAVAYARIRKVGNSDYQRTERQREVLMKLLDNVKAMDLEDIDRLATRLLPMLTHNIPESEFWGLLAKVPTLLNYNIVQDRIPYDGMFQSINGNLVPNSELTIRRLKETIYGKDALDEEGNVVTPTPEPEETETDATQSQNIDEEVQKIEAEIGNGDLSSRMVQGVDRDQSVITSLQPGKKAAVVADNVESVTEDSNSTVNSTGSGDDAKEPITNPYMSKVFVLKVPDAPIEKNVSLVDGDYQWKKHIISQGISK